MKKYIPLLRQTQLFSGVGEEDLYAMLGCLQARLMTYKKGEYVFRQGEQISLIALTVEGCLHIQSDDYWGHRSIVRVVEAGGMLGQSYAAPDSGPLQNDVLAVRDSVVIVFDVGKLLGVCSSACRFHSMVVQNLFYAISEQNRLLIRKLGHMSNRTTREKLMSYLSAEAKRQKSASFSISLNRQQLADYLSVDRSAMSNELCKMRDEGLLRFDKSSFTLLQGRE